MSQHAQTSEHPSLASAPKFLFIYGTLCAIPLLALVLTGNAQNTSIVSKLLTSERVYGYARFSLHNRDYPAAVKGDPHSYIDGYLLRLKTNPDRKKIDNYEGEAYRPTSVAVKLIDAAGEPRMETVEADIYVWTSRTAFVTREPWELEVFVKERLCDWLDIFEGMEFCG
ncbi:hypothetical protein M426DRAFT_59898 [Hypoxylon sp. CI-4A]|nr:hypothetical protein M426DRAFT_59898 [Hypoxylon sp. CI-4A]